jgi:small subunit ribosomal protein S2
MEEKDKSPATKVSEGEEKNDFNIDIEEMAKVGLHFGHKKSKINPKMEPYLYGVRNGIHIIDLDETKKKLLEALLFIKELIAENKIILIVGTKIQVKELVKNFATECSLPYVSERWVGGTFTNFEVIKKRINYFKDLEEKKNKGELEKYTKKEILGIEKDLQEFNRKFGGIKNLDRLPDAIFVLGIENDALAVKEAGEKNIKIIGISDTNADPTLADFFIPANDDAVSAVKYILDKVKKVILEARKNPSENKSSNIEIDRTKDKQ